METRQLGKSDINIEISKSDRLKLSIHDIPGTLTDKTGLPEQIKQFTTLAGFLALSLSDFGPDLGFKAFQTLVGTGTVVSGIELLYKRYSKAFTHPISKLAYPEVGEKNSFSEIKSILIDGSRAVFGFREKSLFSFLKLDEKARSKIDKLSFEWRSKIYSLIEFKNMLLQKVFIASEKSGDISMITEIIKECPDPELKLEIINNVSRNYKNLFRDYVVANSNSRNEIVSAMCARLKKDWWNLDDKRSETLNNIKFETILKNSLRVFEVINKELNLPKTMEPLLKLYILRIFREEVSNNRIPTPDKKNLVNKIKKDFNSYVSKFDILNEEAKYDPERTTIGFEMQPEAVNKITFTKTDLPTIKKIIKYGDLGWQNDLPFEIIIPPTRTATVQVLILAELCKLTGININNVGLQISFGGIRKESNVKMLQRMVLLDGRLISTTDITVYGDGWNLGSSKKGEIDQKEVGYDATSITPKDVNRQEFNYIAEMRASVSSVNFFTFCKGIFTAHRMANSIKALERAELGHKLSKRELKLISRLKKSIRKINKVCEVNDLPYINENWSHEDWATFGRFLPGPEKLADF